MTTSLEVLPDEEIIVTEPGYTEPRYPWAASDPRWALQAALQAALAGTLSPEEALAQAQRETDYWLSSRIGHNQPDAIRERAARITRRPRPPLHRMSTRQRIWRARPWYVLLAVPLVLFLTFVIWPTINAFRLSLFTMRGRDEVFVGFDNYARLLNNQVFIDAIINTALLGVAFLVIVLPLSLILASLMNGIRHLSTPFKVIYFLPQVTSAVAIALIFNYIFQPDWGLINAFLRNLGVEHPPCGWPSRART